MDTTLNILNSVKAEIDKNRDKNLTIGPSMRGDPQNDTIPTHDDLFLKKTGPTVRPLIRSFPVKPSPPLRILHNMEPVDAFMEMMNSPQLEGYSIKNETVHLSTTRIVSSNSTQFLDNIDASNININRLRMSGTYLENYHVNPKIPADSSVISKLIAMCIEMCLAFPLLIGPSLFYCTFYRRMLPLYRLRILRYTYATLYTTTFLSLLLMAFTALATFDSYEDGNFIYNSDLIHYYSILISKITCMIIMHGMLNKNNPLLFTMNFVLLFVAILCGAFNIEESYKYFSDYSVLSSTCQKFNSLWKTSIFYMFILVDFYNILVPCCSLTWICRERNLFVYFIPIMMFCTYVIQLQFYFFYESFW